MYIISYYVKRLYYHVKKKLGYLVYDVCELVYTTSFSLNTRLVLSTQCPIMAKDYVIMLKRGVILVNQYVVLFNCVVSEKNTFKTYIFLHVYSPRARVDNP